MSTVTKAISSVEFHVNARQANAALQSIQEEAKKCRLQVEELQEQAAKGVTTVKVDGMDVDIQKRIKEVKALQKTWESAAQSQIKGAKAFDELWKNARMGTIESMNGAQIKAGINASKPIYDRLRLGDAEDRMKAQAIKDMQDQGQKVLNQLKTTTDQIIKQIADGETIAADVLEREARNLKSIMDLLPPLSQEWKDYNLQYQAINQQIERQTVLERQLRGEIVTREDAIRVINAANREATQQEIAQEEQRAKAAREAAEAKASEADQYRATVEQKQSEIFATTDLIAAKRREIDAHHESAAAAKDAADKAREAAYKGRKQAEQEAREQQDAYNKQKKIRDDAAKDVEKFRKELEKLGEQDEKRAGVQQKLTDAETRLADENRKLNEEQDKLTDKQTKATEAATKHKQAIQGVKDVMEENRKTGQRLGEEMGELTKQHKQQTEELAEASEKMTDAEKESNRHIKTEQEARLRIQQLNNQSIEQLTASLRVLEEENRRINDPGNQRWQENERYIGQLNLRLEELKKQSAELRGEWMTVADAMKYADSIGTEGFVTTDAETKKATEALQRQRETLVSLIHEKERDGDVTADERQELARLETALAKISTGFADADDVMKRFSEHMNAGKTASEGMAQTLEEKLNARTSSYDDVIKNAADAIEYWENKLEEAKKNTAEFEEELDKLEKKYESRSALGKKTPWGKREKQDIEALRSILDGDGTETNFGWRPEIERSKSEIDSWKENLEYWKQEKAEELGITEEVEEKKQDAQRLTQEQMQEGIKLLEEEYRKTDHTTAEGIKRREQLRKTIGEMNQELKEATGEWMKLGDAQKIAEGAGKKGFAASAQEIQQATQALERRREELIKQIRAERDLGNAVDTQEKELDDLTKKLRSLKFEQDNVNMSQEKMRTLIETPANAVNLDELRAAIKRADGQLRQMQDSLGQNSDEYKRFAEQVRQAKNVMKEMEGQAKASATAWEKAFSRLKTYVVMYMGFNEVWQKITGTMGDMLELSDKMGEVRKTTGFTADEVGRLSENLKGLDVRTNLVSLLEISSSAGQLGLKTLEDVQGFTEAANKLMIALPEMGREAATEMMRVAIATGEVDKIRKQLQEGTIEGSSATAVAMEKIASTIDRLRASSASTAPEITDFVKRVGAVGAQSGITIDQVAALGSTVSSLGMRIEMSATALSRMIPAIRNNAFELAKAIGVTPDTIRNLFDTGRGMEVILMILQRIKDTGMDADSVEQMLGMAGMRDIMKDLNQQGARAGIVFSGLSQNVDELRRQLGVANEAYEENIAIQQEFDKMNETTAAKWERLKNELEEGFVGDKPQRLLGGIIDGLRKIVDFMVGDSSISSAFRTILVYLGLVRMQLISLAAGALTSVGGGLRNIGIMLGFIKGEMTKLQWGNIFTALAGAVLYAYMAFKDLKSAAEKAQEALGKTKDDVARAQEQFEGYWRKLKDTSVALEQARKSHDQLSAEVDKLRNSTDKSATATENLKKKEDELKKSEDSVTKASNDHKTAISQMNSIYGKYLGFILTETNYANLAAAAHNKVAAAIEREMLMKQKQAAISEVDSNYSADIASNYGKLSERLTQQGLNRSQASQAMADLQKFLRKNVSYDAATNETTVSKAVTDQLKRSGLNLSKATSNEIVALWYDKYLKDTYHLSDRSRMNITGVKRTADRDEGWQNVYSPFATNVRGGYADTYVRRERERGSVSAVYNADITRVEGEETKAAGTLLQKLEKEANDAKTKILDKATSDKDRNDAYINLANALEGLDNRINELDPKKDAETINRLRDMAKSLSGEGISIKKLTAARREIHSTLFDRATFDENAIRETGNANPWGTSEPGESTNWKEMTAEQLVNRREQMNKFVNSLQTDTDVKAVLEEDKALKKAIEAGMSSDMRTVIEWYNTERLKIQDELHARHLTNTGDWLDPKKERGAKKQFRDEMGAYLHELDAYYTERKTRIEQARNDEEITEGEAWRRTIQNDNEWQTRRAELQKLYSRKQQEVTKEELDAIIRIIAERTGDSESFVKAAIAKTNQFVDAIEKSGDKGAAIVHRWMSQVVLDTERSYLKAAQAIGKQMKFIEDTLAKERPYDGITKNLQENLDKMGVLAAKFRRENEELARQGKEPKYSNEQITAQSYDEMAFYLRQAADAYSIDIDELLRRMVKEGMAATAEEISKSDMLKQAVMGQLRKTYQEVQDAVKKEASQIKKDVEIIWNDDARGIGGMSMKATFDKALAQLGMQQDSVSRANSLIGAGAASDNVASRLAMKQIEVQMRMQKAQYDMYRVQANQRMAALKAEAEEHRRLAKLAEKEKDIREASRQNTLAENALLDARNVKLSLGLTLAEETKKEEQQKAELLKIQEESQNRLYTSLREWADLLTSSLQGVMEASHAGDAEYYNERAKLNLTGKGGPGAGTYVVIDDAGTSDATAHYEYLDKRQALERQHEIEIQNAQAEAWRKLMDDINMKMSEQITDWMNAALQNQSIDANTQAVIANTEALWAQLGQTGGQQNGGDRGIVDVGNGETPPAKGSADTWMQNMVTNPSQPTEKPAVEAPAPAADGEMPTWKPGYMMTDEERDKNLENMSIMFQNYRDMSVQAETEKAEMIAEIPGYTKPVISTTEEDVEKVGEISQALAQKQMEADNAVAENKIQNDQRRAKSEKQNDQQMTQSSSSMFAKMTQAANLYGVAYQAMSNDNLDTAQKFEMIALQAVGNAAIAGLQVLLSDTTAKTAANKAATLSKDTAEHGSILGPILFAVSSALIGGLMGMAASRIAKSKSEISQATGASVGAGRLTTGMLTYAEGNVNELTDPASLTPGRQYNVDGADGKTYRAKYMGKGAKTHITNGPEFYLVGEAGREAIIDAKTTRLLQMNETGIWRDIQTLYNGGSIAGLSTRRRRGSVRAFAEGNIGEFEDMADGGGLTAEGTGGMSAEMMTSMLETNSRLADLLESALTNGIKAVNKWTGSDGIPAMYNKMQKEAQRHGEKYL